MCETNAYILKDDKEELLMDSVILLRPEDGKIYLRGLLGKEMYVEADIQEINFLDHRMVLKEK
ncbi:MAG: CooT family nickel-binding protein [Thermodesulfobacteriota bacterium]|jgi:predicted RNA-binding protein|nr:CooT family nickel-binding protein [Deltaproteobacteria bacterium]MDQ7838756.1 CooT family nickel-binding protein [Thermodesulfobacteriota bacterium]